jgi:hypothetical protein
LQEIEIRAYFADLKRLADEERQRREDLEEQRRIAKATARLIESNRAEVLNTQVTAWQKARQLDEYLAAMAQRIVELDDPKATQAASEWLVWARSYAARIDPLNRTIAMPPDPEPDHDSPAAVHATENLQLLVRRSSGVHIMARRRR